FGADAAIRGAHLVKGAVQKIVAEEPFVLYGRALAFIWLAGAGGDDGLVGTHRGDGGSFVAGSAREIRYGLNRVHRVEESNRQERKNGAPGWMRRLLRFARSAIAWTASPRSC